MGEKNKNTHPVNSRTDEFLDLYKKLEQLLKQNYSNDRGHYESVVARYENSRDCGNMKDELNSIREIRNLLQHIPKINNRYIIEPSEDIMKALHVILDRVEHPRLAIDFGVPDGKIYKASLGSSLLKVINAMKEKGFSHVPIIENNKLYGVLSSYAVFEFVTEQGMQILSDETKVKDMKSYLPIDRHRNEYYRFMPKTTTFIEADEAFEKRDEKRRRLVSIFITDHGRNDEPIRAMLTPWSVVGK